jgi:repressor LexA
MQELTERQREVLAFIVRFRNERGVPPSLRELARGLGLASINGVSQHLDALQRKRYIDRGPAMASRAIRVLREAP